MATLDGAIENTFRKIIREELASFAARSYLSTSSQLEPEAPGERVPLLDVADRFALVPYVEHVLTEAGGGPMSCKEIAARVYSLGFEHRWPPKHKDQLVRSINALASPSQHPEKFERVAPRVIKLR